MLNWLLEVIKKKGTGVNKIPSEMKYLITGLGNIGSEYAHTRHNIGFDVLDALAKEESVKYEDKRYGFVTRFRHKGRIFVLLKPTTYVNLSGRAVNYWLQKEKIPVENLLVVADDLALSFGKLRLKAKGSHAGHNGLGNIQDILGHNQFARLRFGIGDNYRQGHQVDYVLGKWDTNEKKELPEHIEKACEIIRSFATLGVARSMNLHNKK